MLVKSLMVDGNFQKGQDIAGFGFIGRWSPRTHTASVKGAVL